jgi:hypothetical protein
MRNSARILLLGFVLAAVPGLGFAQGEIFKIETSGLEHCSDLDNFRFGAKNNTDLWVRVASDLQWDLAPSPNFTPEETISILGRTYFSTQRKLVFTGAAFLADNAFVAFEGTAPLDSSLVIKKLSGTFIQDAGDTTPCISSGKWKSVDRVFP